MEQMRHWRCFGSGVGEEVTLVLHGEIQAEERKIYKAWEEGRPVARRDPAVGAAGEDSWRRDGVESLLGRGWMR